MNPKKTLIFIAIILLLFTLARVSLLIAYPDIFKSLIWSERLLAFLNGLRFDFSIAMACTGLLFLLLNLPIAAARKSAWIHLYAWLLFGMTVLFVFTLIAGVLYFPFAGRHLANEWTVLGNDLSFLYDFAVRGHLHITLATIIVIIGLGFLWKKIINIQEPTRKNAAFFVALLFIMLIGIRGTFEGKSLSIAHAYQSGSVAFGNLSLNSVYTSIHYSRRAGHTKNYHFMSDEEALAQAGLEASAEKDFPLLQHYKGKPNQYNIVLFVMESWDAYFIDSFSDKKNAATPHFDALAKKSLRFPRFYASANRSIDGLQAILTGVPKLPNLPYLGHGIELNNFSKLGAVFKQQGYSTLFVQSSNRASYRLDSIAGLLGFDTFYGKEDIPLLLDYPEEAPKFGWDYETFLFALDKINQGKKPFLATVFSGSTHPPYPQLPEKFSKHEFSRNKLGGFLNTLAYSDYSLNAFLEQAKKTDWFANTIFVITADHTAGARYREPDFAEDYRIPLIIYAPNIVAADSINTVSSQIDLLPTIVDLAGIETTIAAYGQSLLSKTENIALVSRADQLGIITENKYLVHNLDTRLDFQYTGNGNLQQTATATEKKLLGTVQALFKIWNANRWAPE